MKNKQYPYYPVDEISDLKELINHCAEKYSDKIAFWYRKKKEVIEVTYRQLKNDIDALGTFFLCNGIENAHIGLLGENSYEWIISYFAIVNSGNVVVPIDKELPVSEIEYLLKKADCSYLIHSDTYSGEAETLKESFDDLNLLNMSGFCEILKCGADLISSGKTEYFDYKIEQEKCCAIVFTSGTTGEPKGVMLSHKNLASDAMVSSKNLFVPKGTVLVLPLYHTFGTMSGVLCQLLRGYPVFINNSLRKLLDDIKFAKPQHISVVPMLIEVFYNKIWDNIKEQRKEKQLKTLIKLSNLLLKIGIDLRKKLFKSILSEFGGELEMLISGGALIDEKYIKFFRDIGIKVTNGYGITECSPIVATMRNKHYSPSSVGSVYPSIGIRIVDDEIQLKGDIVFSGYYKNEEATKEAFDGEWFKTGDLGYLDKDGLLYITGRKKNLIILSNGKNVSPEELENKLYQIKGIKEVLVYGENDFITAEIYTENPNTEEQIRAEITEMNKSVPIYKQIHKIKFRETEFEKTSTKKIKRR